MTGNIQTSNSVNACRPNHPTLDLQDLSRGNIASPCDLRAAQFLHGGRRQCGQIAGQILEDNCSYDDILQKLGRLVNDGVRGLGTAKLSPTPGLFYQN